MTEYVEAAINAPGDISFTYLVPEELKGRLSLYQRVIVPLGNRKAIAFVIGFPASSPVKNLKNILAAYDPLPVLDKNLSGLAFGWRKNMLLHLECAFTRCFPIS